MGESKKRKEKLGELYGHPDQQRAFAGLPITKGQVQAIYKFTVTGTWICIGALVVLWIIVQAGVQFNWWGN